MHDYYAFEVVKDFSPVVYGEIYDDDDWWAEQVDRCLNGYETRLGKITGAHYFYLNFVRILASDGRERRKKLLPPLYRELDKEFFWTLERARQEGKNVIIVKARDKGFSYMMTAYILWEWLFFPFNEVGVGAQKEVYVNTFRKRFEVMLSNLPGKLQLPILESKKDRIVSGYKRKTEAGWQKQGTQTVLHLRTIKDPDTFRGERLRLLLFEEAGEIDNLLRAFMASLACVKEGAEQFGTIVIGGTVNKFGKGYDDFKELWYNAEKYNMIRFFIGAHRALHGFFDPATGKDDEEGAKRYIKEQAEKLRRSGNSSAYYMYLQEYPTTVEEAFLDAANSVFDIGKLNDRYSYLMTNDVGVQEGYMIRDKNGDVLFKPVKGGPVKIYLHPLPQHLKGKNVDIGGVDPYMFAEVHEKISRGACVIYRRFYSANEVCELPVCIYADRPDDKEEFYRTIAMIAEYYGCKMLVENSDPELFSWFRHNRKLNLLLPRPRLFETRSPLKYGINMKVTQKALVTELLNKYINQNVDMIMFPELIDDLRRYGKGRDDLAMAFGIALIADLDLPIGVVDEEKTDDNQIILPRLKYVDGKIIVDNFVNKGTEGKYSELTKSILKWHI